MLAHTDQLSRGFPKRAGELLAGMERANASPGNQHTRHLGPVTSCDRSTYPQIARYHKAPVITACPPTRAALHRDFLTATSEAGPVNQSWPTHWSLLRLAVDFHDLLEAGK